MLEDYLPEHTSAKELFKTEIQNLTLYAYGEKGKEIMSDKKESDYLKLINHLDTEPSQFMMTGNSVKSNVLPVLAISGHGVHVPYHITWAHEHVEHNVEHGNLNK